MSVREGEHKYGNRGNISGGRTRISASKQEAGASYRDQDRHYAYQVAIGSKALVEAEKAMYDVGGYL